MSSPSPNQVDSDWRNRASPPSPTQAIHTGHPSASLVMAQPKFLEQGAG